MESLEDTELNLIFDRTFFTEEVYSILGYKEYRFDKAYDRLVKKLSQLDFNIYLVVLYCKDTSLYEERLRRQHHNYQAFSVENSVNQQNTYLKLLDEIEYDTINKIKLCVDNYDEAYKILIDLIPVLKDEGIIYHGINNNN